MKSYQIIENLIEKEFSWGKMPVLKVGREGRGRHYELVPFQGNAQGEYFQLAFSRSGKPKIVNGKSSKGWLAVLNSTGVYTRNTYGSCYTPTPGRVKVVAMGYGAYGDAGRIGQWNEFLVEILPETFIKIKPAGGSYKIAPYWLYFSQREVFSISEEEIDLFCENRGVLKPPEELKDLAYIKEGIMKNYINISSEDWTERKGCQAENIEQAKEMLMIGAECIAEMTEEEMKDCPEGLEYNECWTEENYWDDKILGYPWY